MRLNALNSNLRLNLWACLAYGAIVCLLARIFYPTFIWMVERWNAADSYYGHGFLIPIVSIYWVWKKRQKLLAMTREPSIKLGSLCLAFSCVLQLMSALFRVYFLSAGSFVCVLASLVLLIGGKKFLKEIYFPVFFLMLMVPLPLLMISEVTLKMKFLASEIATAWIQNSGIQAVRKGSYIYTPHAAMVVADPCSGLRSLLVFVVFGLIFAYESQVSWWRRSALFMSSLPIALYCNVLRIWFLGLFGEIYGMQYTGPGAFPHDASGFAVFGIGFIALMFARKVAEMGYAKK